MVSDIARKYMTEVMSPTLRTASQGPAKVWQAVKRTFTSRTRPLVRLSFRGRPKMASIRTRSPSSPKNPERR